MAATYNIPTTVDSYGTGLTTEIVLCIAGTYHRHGIGAVPAWGEARKVENGPKIPGPWAYTYPLAACLDTMGGTGAVRAKKLADGTEIDVTDGDELVIDRVAYRVRIDRGQWIALDPTNAPPKTCGSCPKWELSRTPNEACSDCNVESESTAPASRLIGPGHTPGPWTVNDDFPKNGLVESEFGMICEVKGFEEPDDETMPNARLLAAAPYLLEALRDIAADCDAILADDGQKRDCDDILGAFRDHAYDAIAKATA